MTASLRNALCLCVGTNTTPNTSRNESHTCVTFTAPDIAFLPPNLSQSSQKRNAVPPSLLRPPLPPSYPLLPPLSPSSLLCPPLSSSFLLFPPLSSSFLLFPSSF